MTTRREAVKALLVGVFAPASVVHGLAKSASPLPLSLAAATEQPIFKTVTLQAYDLMLWISADKSVLGGIKSDGTLYGVMDHANKA